jgi:hypothetical protein
MLTSAPTDRASVLSRIRALAKVLASHDHLPRERKLTARVAKKSFGPKDTWHCALCGRAKPEVPDIGRAHIVALEEGGKTRDDNLIPLCEGERRVSTALGIALDWYSEHQANDSISLAAGLARVGISEAQLGCHKLFDAGLISTANIRDVRSHTGRWGHYNNLRDQVFAGPISSLATEFNPTSARARGVRGLRHRLSQLETGSEEWFLSACKLISAARRLANPEFLSLALRYTTELDRFATGRASSVSLAGLALFFYEKALVFMVQQPEPDLTAAIRALQRSCDCARTAKDNRSFALSRLEWVHAKTFAAGPMTASAFQALTDEQERAIALLGKTAGEPRWMFNHLIHKAQLQVKANRVSMTRDTVARARALRETLTVSTGWAQFQAVHINSIEGAILALEGEYADALRLLARALIPMKASRGKRPEGYLDVARCAAWVLKRKGQGEEARELEELAKHLRDGRSGFWPHQ